MAHALRHRSKRFIVAIAFALLASAAVLASSASALETRLQIEEFGPGGSPSASFQHVCGLALNQSTKTLYVLDQESEQIFAFDMSTPGAPTELHGNFPLDAPGASGFSGLAVDNTSLTSAGNIYYTSYGEGKIYGFDSSGEPLGGEFPISPPAPTHPSGIAVDPAGHIWVADFAVDPVTKTAIIRRYNSDGTGESTPVEFDSESLGNPSWPLALDANGDVYSTMYRQESLTYKFTAASGYGAYSVIDPSTIGGKVGNIAVDTATHELYAALQGATPSLVEVYDSAGTRLYGFGEISGVENTQYQAVAINQETGEIYLYDNRHNEAGLQKVQVFGPYGPVAEVVAKEPSGLTGTHATLHAEVNPGGIEVTECKFEYGKTEAYGHTKSCEGTIPADSTFHAVSADVSELAPQGTTYHFRVVVSNSTGPSKTADQTFETPDTFFTEPGSSIGPTSATLNGSVTPDGVGIDECFFEYGRTSTPYDHTAGCAESEGEIGTGPSPVSVHADVTPLAEGTKYHFRLVVDDGLGGPFRGDDATLTTNGPPRIDEQTGAATGTTAADVAGLVNPAGFLTTYHFEYDTTAYRVGEAAHGTNAPASNESIGEGSSDVGVSQVLEGLAPNTTYHYRIVATNARGTSEGPDQTFTTDRADASCPNGSIRAAQTSSTLPSGSTVFPDCMALEMVSPPRKYNQYAFEPSISPDGDRVMFRSVAALANTQNQASLVEPYIATRTASAWSIEPTAPPADITGGFIGAALPCSYNTDLSHWTTWASTGGQVALGFTVAYRGGLGGLFTPLSPLLTPQREPNVEHGRETAIDSGLCEGGTADASRVLFAIPGFAYLPSDPSPPSDGGSYNVYEASLDAGGSPSVALLQRDRAGKVWGGACGAHVGAAAVPFIAYRGSVAPDGSRVYFTTRPAQPEAAETCDTSHPRRIMVREETESGPLIEELIPGGPASGSDTYQGASQEGARVFFTSSRQLVAGDGDATSDLYLYDAAAPAEHLVQVSAGDASDPTPGEGAEVLGVADVSGDGSHVYFVARGQLTLTPNMTGEVAQAGKPNLYLYERDAAHPTGRIAFVGTLDPSDSGVWSSGPGKNEAAAVPLLGPDPEDQAVGGDGHVLVFRSKASLVPGDSDGGHADIYRYDAETGAIELVSKPTSGGGGPFDVDRYTAEGEEQGPQTTTFGRFVSEGGRVIVFSTAEALDPIDTNSVDNAYVWRDGSVTPLPGIEPTVSMSGREVAFASYARLLAEDGDGAKDVYVARVDGGYPIPPKEPPICTSVEECQGPAAVAPSGPNALSESANGHNVRPRGGCAALGRHARRLTHRAKALGTRARSLRGRAMHARNPRRARRLRHTARRLARSAKRRAVRAKHLSRRTKRCRRAIRRARR